MKDKNFKFAFLSGNALKILAAIFMVIDHVGLMFFPDYIILRKIGRLAFPIFAFMIAEGCKYTKNKPKYFAMIFLMGVIFQVVYYVVEKSTYMCIFITFSTSILMIYALQYFKKQLFIKKNYLQKVIAFLIFALSIVAVYVLNKKVFIDYGFWGCMLPVFASMFHADEKDENQKLLQKIDCVPVSVLTLTIGVVLSSIALNKINGIQFYSLFAIILLLLYSGKRGKHKMKYFFYIFYPAHLVLIYAIQYLIYLL